jgi:hypothetical protein
MRWLVMLSVVAVAMAGRAEAQPSPWSEGRSTPGWVFTPSAVFGGLWDSNVTIRNEGSQPVREWVGLVSPRGEIDYNGRHTRVSAGYAGTLHAYRSLDELTRYDQRVRAQASHQVTPRLTLDTRHSAVATPTTDDLEINGLPYVRLGSQMYTGRGGATYALSTRTSLTAEASAQWIRFENSSIDGFNRLRGGHSQGVGASLMHRIGQRLSGGGSWQYVKSELSGSDLTANIQRAQGEIGWVLGPSTSIAGSAGISHLRQPAIDASQTGPAFGAGIEHHEGRLRLSAHYEQAFVATYSLGSAVSHRSLSGSAYMPLMRGRMFVSGSGAIRRASPPEETLDVITLDSVVTTATLGFYTARWLRMEAFYIGTFQDSSARGTYNRSRIGIQFVSSKPMRID